MKQKEPTVTSQVVEHLTKRNDYVETHELCRELCESFNRISAALSHLRKHRAVDCIVDHGQVWWFILPVEMDTRSHHVDQRAPETRPRKPRKRRLLGPRNELE